MCWIYYISLTYLKQLLTLWLVICWSPKKNFPWRNWGPGKGHERIWLRIWKIKISGNSASPMHSRWAFHTWPVSKGRFADKQTGNIGHPLQENEKRHSGTDRLGATFKRYCKIKLTERDPHTVLKKRKTSKNIVGICWHSYRSSKPSMKPTLPLHVYWSLIGVTLIETVFST